LSSFLHAQLLVIAIFANDQLSFHCRCADYVTTIVAHAQVSTFAINYRGHPFMESLTENRALLYSLAGAGGFVVMLALGKPAFQKPNS
jgi:cation-transporting ATPase 13A1